MREDYTILAVFEYSTEAQLVKSKLDSEGIKTMLMDEKTIDTDPMISQAIGGVKLLVHNSDLEKASEIYNEIRTYEKDADGNDINCIACSFKQNFSGSSHNEKASFLCYFLFLKAENLFVMIVK